MVHECSVTGSSSKLRHFPRLPTDNAAVLFESTSRQVIHPQLTCLCTNLVREHIYPFNTHFPARPGRTTFQGHRDISGGPRSYAPCSRRSTSPKASARRSRPPEQIARPRSWLKWSRHSGYLIRLHLEILLEICSREGKFTTCAESAPPAHRLES